MWTSLYKKNETTDKYVKVEDMNEKEYQSNHKPVYEENNMKNKESTPIRFSGGIRS